MPKKGTVNNPKGRPAGAKNKTNKETVDLLLKAKPELIRIAIKEAKSGNNAILAKLLDKITPTLTENKNEVEHTFNINFKY